MGMPFWGAILQFLRRCIWDSLLGIYSITARVTIPVLISSIWAYSSNYFGYDVHSKHDRAPQSRKTSLFANDICQIKNSDPLMGYVHAGMYFQLDTLKGINQHQWIPRALRTPFS